MKLPLLSIDGVESNSFELSDKMISLAGSDIIDVGCESSRPGADSVDVLQEMDRLNMALDLLSVNNRPHSIDTSKYEIAEHAIKNGFSIIDLGAAPGGWSQLIIKKYILNYLI